MKAGTVLGTPPRRTQEVLSPMPTQRTCSIPDCNRDACPRGSMCKRHTQRVRDWGDPRPDIPFRRQTIGTTAERFAAFVTVGEGCWEWTGQTRRDRRRPGPNYAVFTERQTPEHAARVSYPLFVGPIPGGMTIDHLCTNVSCVRPDHLELVTLAENLRRRDGGMLRYAAWFARRQKAVSAELDRIIRETLGTEGA